MCESNELKDELCAVLKERNDLAIRCDRLAAFDEIVKLRVALPYAYLHPLIAEREWLWLECERLNKRVAELAEECSMLLVARNLTADDARVGKLLEQVQEHGFFSITPSIMDQELGSIHVFAAGKFYYGATLLAALEAFAADQDKEVVEP